EHDHPVGNGWAYHYRPAHRQRVGWRHLQPGDDGGFQFARRWYAYGGEGGFAHELFCSADGCYATAGQGVDPRYKDQPDPDNYGRIWPRAASTNSDTRHAPGCRAALGCSSLDARTPSSDDPELVPDSCDRKAAVKLNQY